MLIPDLLAVLIRSLEEARLFDQFETETKLRRDLSYKL